eukprot:g4494.t1
MDWVPKERLTAEQRAACPRGCDGAYVEPESDREDAKQDPTDAELRAEAGSTEINALTQAASLGGYVVFSQGWREVAAESVSVNREDSEYLLEGDVSIREPGLLVVGDSASVDGEDNSLSVKNATYLLHNSRLRGSSTEIRREGNAQFVIDNASYTSCEPGEDSWILTADELRLNEETGVASGRNVVVRTAGIPVFYTPYISYPIDDRPRSGLLYPSLKVASEDGADFEQPIYWSMAENQDITFSPRYIEKRGSGLEVEHRYLADSTYTQSTGSFFPTDRSGDRSGLYDDDSRWMLNLGHQGYLKGFWTELDITRVSDIDYFEDYGNSVLDDASVSNLRQYGSAGYQQGNWQLSLIAENFQSLVVENGNEYQRLPELEITGEGTYGADIWWQLDYQYSLFDHARDDVTGATGFQRGTDGTWVTGQRLRAAYSSGWRSESSWYHFAPTIGVDYLYYRLDTPLEGQTITNPSEAAPNASLEFGLAFERNADLFGQRWVQTLEPEVFYFYRDVGEQNDMPLFDTTLATTSYDQLFRRNSFVGGDRLSDNHQMTLGLSSSLYNFQTGRELGRFRIAQAFYLEDRVVHASSAIFAGLTDPGALDEDDPLLDAAIAGRSVLNELEHNRSDLIATLDLNVTTNWNINSEVVWDGISSSVERTQVLFTYKRPDKNQEIGISFFKEKDVVYLRDRDGDGFSSLEELLQETVEQASITGIMEVGDSWNLITRWQHDFSNDRALDSIVGLSYENCCWNASLTWRRWLERDDSDGFFTESVHHDNGIFFGFEWDLDKIVAVVDDDVVLASELDYRLQSIKQRFRENQAQLPPDAVLNEQILEILVLERLQLATAQRMGIQVSEEQINQTFAQVSASNGLSPEQMMSKMLQEGQSVGAIFRDLRQELTLQQVQQSLVNRRIFVSEAEIDNFLNSAEGKFWAAPTYNLQHILIPLSSNANPDEVISAQTLADSIYEQLMNGADFGTLAVQFSSGPSALEGGQLGWRRAIEFQPELTAAIENSEVGNPVGPIRAAGGIHIFLTNDIRGGAQEAMVQQTKTRHILLTPNTLRPEEETKQLVEELRQRVIDGEDFETLAKEYSEDISNAMNGGDLDWVLPGMMVAPFEQAMNEATVGVVSAPVETRFGWHILLVEERRDVDMSNDIMRNQARNVLRSQRFEEELDLWQRELRNDAFAGHLYVSPVALNKQVVPGKLDPGNASYVVDTLENATQGCLDGIFDAMVTAPVQKSIINDAGIPFSGHTEFLQEKAGVAKVVMMLASPSLRVALVTTHLPLRDVADALTADNLRQTLEILHQDLSSRFGIDNPHILVAGLNPHAGESGHLGTEEIEIMLPIIEECQNRGMSLQGPLPADTLFTEKYLNHADAVLAMYHDQGLPVLKSQGFGDSVNITLGLPFIRTSVDHGTALDLAGTGFADEQSLRTAIKMAQQMAASAKPA